MWKKLEKKGRRRKEKWKMIKMRKNIRKGELLEREGKRKAGLQKGRKAKKKEEDKDDGLKRKSLIFVLSTSDNLGVKGPFLSLFLCLNSRTLSVLSFIRSSSSLLFYPLISVPLSSPFCPSSFLIRRSTVL